MIKTCIICKNIFETKNKKKQTCSNSCRATFSNKKRYKNHRENRICIGCGVQYETTLSNTKKYCSNQCFNKNKNISEE